MGCGSGRDLQTVDVSRTGSSHILRVQAPADGKLPILAVGEVVRARIVEVMPGGDALLRVKGALIHVKSDLQLTPDTLALFRVTEMKGEKGVQQVRLQMMETLPEPKADPLAAGPGLAALQGITHELEELLTAQGRQPADLMAAIERLLKVLPEDSSKLPKDLRGQIFTLLQTCLRTEGQTIPSRLQMALGDALVQDLPEWLELKVSVPKGLAPVEDLPRLTLQTLLKDTGVAFESKVRALAAVLPEAMPDVDEGEGAGPLFQTSGDEALVQTDLKASLLDLKQRILDSMERHEADAGPMVDSRVGEGTARTSPQSRVLELLDGLLRDIETFQALSKVTDSFYTFLPLVWDGLREGEIAFKRSRGGGGERSSYCMVQLDFEHMGRLKVLTLKQGEDFFVSFETDNEALKSMLRENIRELAERFAGGGLHLKAADFHGSSERRLAPFEQLESVENILSIRI